MHLNVVFLMEVLCGSGVVPGSLSIEQACFKEIENIAFPNIGHGLPKRFYSTQLRSLQATCGETICGTSFEGTH